MTLSQLYGNDRFFIPLCGKYRDIYFDCACILAQESSRMPVLYETDSRKLITAYLAGRAATVRQEEDGSGEQSQTYDSGGENRAYESGQTDPADSASEPNAAADGSGETREADAAKEPDAEQALSAPLILARLRECGWIKPREIARNGEYTTALTGICRDFISFTQRLMNPAGTGTMSNEIFTMYEIIRSVHERAAFRLERPYSNILVPLLEAEQNLRNELTHLADDIHVIMRGVIARQDANSLGQFLIRDDILKRFFSEYFFMKREGTIPTLIARIREGLSEIREGELYEGVIRECAASRSIDREAAEDVTERGFSELQRFLEWEYDERMHLIDDRITNYYRLANSRIVMMSSGGMENEEILTALLDALKGLPEDEEDAVYARLLDAVRIRTQRYVDRRSFALRQKKQQDASSLLLAASSMTDEEKARRTRELIETSVNRFSAGAVSAYLDGRIAEGASVDLKEHVPASRDEAIMLAAALIYASDPDFTYDVTLEGGMVENEEVTMRDMVIRHRTDQK